LDTVEDDIQTCGRDKSKETSFCNSPEDV